MQPATALARAILDELVHQGVTELVLAPGSRSAPLAFAAARLADAGVLRLHVRIDERSAGFLALGLAKVSGAPVAVMCTSGTAVANLAPAVVEASYSAIPLVVVTADRPVEARGVGAPQTIDQVEFFGGMVRRFVELGAPPGEGPDPDPVRGVGPAVAGAVATALGSHPEAPGRPAARPGPVHVNVGLRPPLVPDPVDLDDPLAPAPSGVPRVRRPPLDGCGSRDLAEVLGEVPTRGVVVVGDLPCTSLRAPHQWLASLAQACGWPVIAEPSANLHAAPTALGHGVLVLGAEDFLAEHTPDVVLSAGLFGLSRPTLALVRAARRHVALDLPSAGREVCDPLRTARQVLAGIPLPPTDHEPDPTWLEAWRGADQAAARVVAGALADGPLSAAAVVARVWQGAPADGLLLVGASWPVRQVEAFAGTRPGLRVVGNRGANGIDGLVSTAWGAALAHQAQGGGPALALIGDLALLHDHNGLLVQHHQAQPDLVLVVLDNDGGGIFHQLEQGRPEYAGDFERLFGTPQGRDLVAVCRAAGVPATRVHDLAGLDEALAAAHRVGGVRAVIAHVPDRVAEAALLADVRAQVAAAVDGRWET